MAKDRTVSLCFLKCHPVQEEKQIQQKPLDILGESTQILIMFSCPTPFQRGSHCVCVCVYIHVRVQGACALECHSSGPFHFLSGTASLKGLELHQVC